MNQDVRKTDRDYSYNSYIEEKQHYEHNSLWHSAVQGNGLLENGLNGDRQPSSAHNSENLVNEFGGQQFYDERAGFSSYPYGYNDSAHNSNADASQSSPPTFHYHPSQIFSHESGVFASNNRSHQIPGDISYNGWVENHGINNFSAQEYNGRAMPQLVMPTAIQTSRFSYPSDIGPSTHQQHLLGLDNNVNIMDQENPEFFMAGGNRESPYSLNADQEALESPRFNTDHRESNVMAPSYHLNNGMMFGRQYPRHQTFEGRSNNFDGVAIDSAPENVNSILSQHQNSSFKPSHMQQIVRGGSASARPYQQQQFTQQQRAHASHNPYLHHPHLPHQLQPRGLQQPGLPHSFLSNNGNILSKGSALAQNSNSFHPNQHPVHGGGAKSAGHGILTNNPGTGGSNAQGRAINKMLLEILKERNVDPNRLALAIDANIERMDCVNLATLLFHTGKKRLLLTPSFIKRLATRFSSLKEELRAREASNSLYGLKCMSSECLEVRQLILAIAGKIASSTSELVAQAVGNALYGCQMMTSDHDEVRYLLQILSNKVNKCMEPLEAQNVGNALYGLRGMNSDHKEVRNMIAALTPKVLSAREDLNGQALGNSLYGLQCMTSKESEVRQLLTVLAVKVTRCWEDLKAQEVGNALYGLKRMSSDVLEVRTLIDALVPKISSSPEILDAQAIGNSFYGMQNMKSDSPTVLLLLATMAEKVSVSCAELDGQAMGNSLYGLQGMSSDYPEVRAVIDAITVKLQSSCLEMNAQELGNAVYGLQNMTSSYPEVRRLLMALAQKVASSKHDLTSQEIGNALFGLQGIRSDSWESRALVNQLAIKVSKSHSLLDPQGIANSLFGLQKMSSECDDVRQLINALAIKIEQSWKLLNAQHIANAMFGMQNLSSCEEEVLSLIRALTLKIQACREEMTSKQLSYCMFGLQNMFSQHESVRTLIAAVTEKINNSKDLMTGQQLSLCMFAMQGMDDNSLEVRLLIMALTGKAAVIDSMDPISIGNAFLGLQRMSASFPEICALLNLLAPLVLSAAEQNASDFTPLVCANIVYGLQNCSCTEESVRSLLELTSKRIKDIVSTLVHPSMLFCSFTEVLGLYQSLTLSLLNLPDLDIDQILRDTLLEQQSILSHIVESRQSEHKPSMILSVAESRLVDAVSAFLAAEPFVVYSSELIWGFECAVVIRLKPGVSLVCQSGDIWSPTLNIEMLGSSHSFPSKDLFIRLRTRFLFEQKGIVVEMVPSNILIGQSQNRQTIIDALKGQEQMFNCLYPPSIEDANNFASILYSLGLTGPNGIMTSSYVSNPSTSRLRSNSNSLQSSTTTNSTYLISEALQSLSSDDTSNVGSTLISTFKNSKNEYTDDNMETLTTARQESGVNKSCTFIKGMVLSWIGDCPKVSSLLPHSSYSGHSRPNSSLITNQAGEQTHSSNPLGITSAAGIGGFGRVSNYTQVILPPVTPISQSFVTNQSGESVQQSVDDFGMPSPTAGFASSMALSPAAMSTLELLSPEKQSSLGGNLSRSPIKSISSVGVSLDLPLSPMMQRPGSDLSVTGGRSGRANSGSYDLTSASFDHAFSLAASISDDSMLEKLEPVDTHVGTEVDSEIALLEAQLEIARIEARLLQLKKSKGVGKGMGPSDMSPSMDLSSLSFDN